VFGFQRDGRKYLIFVAIICSVTEAGAALLTSLGALSPDMETGNLLATLLIVILTLLDGACLSVMMIPAVRPYPSSFRRLLPEPGGRAALVSLGEQLQLHGLWRGRRRQE
jgi:hypothetical protein